VEAAFLSVVNALSMQSSTAHPQSAVPAERKEFADHFILSRNPQDGWDALQVK
jgi:hypothetical protein